MDNALCVGKLYSVMKNWPYITESRERTEEGTEIQISLYSTTLATSKSTKGQLLMLCNLLEPCALKGASTVLRGAGASNGHPPTRQRMIYREQTYRLNR